MNYSNNAYSVLNGSITNVATSITVATGTGSRFPASDFRVTLIGYDGSGNENAWEICHCTSRTGDVLTVTRGQEGTTAVAWSNAARIEQRITAGVMASVDPAVGTTSQYWRGDKSWRDFFTDVRAATLTGLSTATNAVITAADTVLSALGKLQKQITDNLSTLTSHTGNTSNPHSVTAAQTGAVAKAGDTMTGSLAFNGTGLRLTGDFSNATLVSRMILQTSTANGGSDLTVIPNGTSNRAGFVSYNNSTPTNSAFAALLALSTDIRLWSGIAGSGTILPLTVYMNNTERLRIDTGGRIQKKGPEDSDVIAVGALDIDCSAGNYFTKTIAGASTFTFSNVPASRAFSFTLELTHTSGTVTWPASVQWPNGTAPSLTTGKTHLFIFVTDDGGTRWRGSSLVNYTT